MSGALSTGKMLTRRRFLVLAGGAAAGAAVSCGGNGGGEFPPSTPGSPVPYTTVTPSPTEVLPVMTELRVAYINLLSPVTTDSNNVVAAETFEDRIAILIEELKHFKPDIVGFSEVFKVKDLQNAQDLLVAGLKMDFQYVRANPWTLGQSREQSDEMVKLAGFEEGELLLVRPPLAALKSTRWALNPRNSESEGRACMHVSVQGPTELGRLDIYVTHLTSDNERIRQQQTTDILDYIRKTRGLGPTILLGDLNDMPDSAAIATFTKAGFIDIAQAAEGEPGYPTCCRESVLGEQPPLEDRTDYILTDRLGPAEVSLLGDSPKTRADGSLLYASDHNGLKAVFQLKEWTEPGHGRT